MAAVKTYIFFWCREKGSYRIICTHVLLEKRRRKKRVLFDWCLIPKRRKTHFLKCHMTNGHEFHGSSTHNSKKRRSLCLLPQQRYHIENHFSYAESVLSRVLHSIGSTLFTATNATPNERFFSFFRRSSFILVAKTRICFLPQFTRHSKNDPLVQEVKLLDVNPTYAHIRYVDGRESSVTLHDLAPCLSQTLVSEKSVSETTAKDCPSEGVTIPVIEKILLRRKITLMFRADPMKIQVLKKLFMCRE